VQAHGGMLLVETGNEQGATVRVRFPAAQAVAEATPEG
jgi:signal transduction histidine kinase